MNAVVDLNNRPNTAVTLVGTGHMALAEIMEREKLIQEVMRLVMKPDVHYGKIPGTDKPSLFKPGAEKLCTVFRIAPTYVVEDLSTEDCVRYRVTCMGTSQVSGVMLGTGMGECSSGEEKYKWLKAYPREWNDTPDTRRRKKYGWNSLKREEYEVLQIRTEPATMANTVLKMANKRAYVAMVLAVLAASDCFSQDLEDMEERLRKHLAGADEDGSGTGGRGGDGSAKDAGDTKEADDEVRYFPEEDFVGWWNGRIKNALDGGRGLDEIVGWIEANKKAKFTELQMKRLRAYKPGPQSTLPTEQEAAAPVGTAAAADPKPAAEAAPAADAPTFTYAQVADGINKAKDLEGLVVAADLIKHVDAGQRKELEVLYAGRRAELEGGPQ